MHLSHPGGQWAGPLYEVPVSHSLGNAGIHPPVANSEGHTYNALVLVLRVSGNGVPPTPGPNPDTQAADVLFEC